MKLEKLLPEIKRNVLLKNYTAFKIGGRAKYFFVAKTKDDLVKTILVARKLKLPFFILGGGSNLLVSDRGFNGLVIKYGQPLSSYVLKGLEWAVSIPGTVQGAVYGNAGAFGKSMADVVEQVEVFDAKTGKVKIFKNKDCHFAYRNSIFKKKKNLIILSVKIKSKKSNPQKIKQYLDYRKKTQPLSFFSAGSVFKNPPPEQSPVRRKSAGFSAGELIEKCNLKGKRVGDAQISEKHANFIINLGNAKAREVKKLINLVKKQVKDRFKIGLEEEICYLGF
jgi:UDP-N-acetylmuramate dehydrogenase